ncbi:MAG: hypothetical protein LIO51_06725, partial [Clostridiales bacterium]|nr:hypothetical protein [Clostridiales bacterium]
MSKYDISGNSYSDWLEEKTNEYNNLIRQAERTRRMQGAASNKEGLLYVEAAKVCQEIRDKHLSERATYAKWELRRKEAVETARQTTDEVAPAPPPPPVKPEPVPVSEPLRRQPTTAG